jgi:outer membrane putative beta-barrel porin/alpha-amylase
MRRLAPCALFAYACASGAQDIEPRSYANTPVGVNFLVVGYAYARGGLSFDSDVPITDAHLRTSSGLVAYARALDVFGMSGKFDAIVPYTLLSGSAQYAGAPITRDVSGFNDARFRVSVNFYGAPALPLSEFRDYRQDLIVGGSLQVAVPWGQYDPSRIVNIGANRWSFKPEIGMSKAAGPWTLEMQAAATFYTDNDDFYGGRRRSQDPLYSFQGHAIYTFRSGIWASVDATYFTGGRTSVDGELDSNLQRNWRVGGTLAVPVDARNSVKLYASSGVSARTGNNFDLIGVGWQCRWGGGV